jgi:hypothetical protein
MTKDVLDHRERLQAIIIGLQRQMKACLAEMEVLRQERVVLKVHKKDITTNKNFSYQIRVPYCITEKLPRDTFVTNCLRCNVTCHFPCGIPDNDRKMGCAAMDNGGI